MHCLCVFYEIKIKDFPEYIYNLIPAQNPSYNACNPDHIETNYCRTNIFKYSFFPYMSAEWIKLDKTLLSSKSYSIF